MPKLPKIKKKVHSFLIKEEGNISKENLLKTGIFLTGVSLMALKVGADNSCPTHNPINHGAHCNDLAITYSTPNAVGEHTHGHGSHASHGSHGSHAQW